MLQVFQKPSDFVVRTLVRHMRERAELCASLESIEIEEEVLLGWQQLDQARSVIFSRPQGGKRMRRCELKGENISGTRNGMSEIRRPSVKSQVRKLGGGGYTFSGMGGERDGGDGSRGNERALTSSTTLVIPGLPK